MSAPGEPTPRWSPRRARADALGAITLDFERSLDGVPMQVTLVRRGGPTQRLPESPVGPIAPGPDAQGQPYDPIRPLLIEIARDVPRWGPSIAASFPHLLRSGNALVTRRRLEAFLAARGELAAAFERPTKRARRREPRALELRASTLAALLGHAFEVGGAPLAGFALRSIGPPEVARGAEPDARAYVAAVTRLSDGARFELWIGLREAVPRPFGVAGALAVAPRNLPPAEQRALPEGLGSLCSWLLVWLTVRQRPGLAWTAPERLVPARAAPIDPGKSGPRGASSPLLAPRGVYGLSLDSDCGQACAFCVVKAHLPPRDEGDADLARWRRELESARRLGHDGVRLGGTDPIAHSRILDLVELVRALGFPRLVVTGPARRFADAAFRRAFFERAPAARTVVVPLYGVTPEVHDAVTGAPGSHAEVMAALEGLSTDLPMSQIALITVACRQNLAELPRVLAYAHARGLSLTGHGVYPLYADDPSGYARAAAREEDVARALAEGLAREAPEVSRAWEPRLSIFVPHPCVLARLGLAVPPPPPRWASRPRLAGTTATTTAAAAGSLGVRTRPCPHVERCGLSPSCPGEHYAQYEETFGLGELEPPPAA
jgi:molybdenum cofactor biosynthesis enzyme MoaA